jgi:hypothetical protein
MVALVWLGCSSIPTHNSDLIRVERITIEGEIVHSPAYIIPLKYYEKYNIPMIFPDHLTQLTFIDNHDNIYITYDDNVLLITYH